MVQGVRLLLHTSLLPQVVLIETPAGCYVFKDYTLQLIPATRGEQ